MKNLSEKEKEKFEDYKGSNNKDKNSIYKIGNCKCFKIFININKRILYFEGLILCPVVIIRLYWETQI